MPDLRRIEVGEISLRVAIEGQGPLVIMVHGFPESWYSWRHQIGPIAAADYAVAAIDVRGYGGSDSRMMSRLMPCNTSWAIWLA